jgi:hypothetical protein
MRAELNGRGGGAIVLVEPESWGAPPAGGGSASTRSLPATSAAAADRLTLRDEQARGARRDEYGRVEPTVPLAQLAVTEVDEWVEAVRAALLTIGDRLPRPDPWGEGRAAVIMTHDVDGPRLHLPFALVRSAILGLLRGNRREAESLRLGILTRVLKRPDPYWGFPVWAELEEALGIRSTAFVYPGATPGCPRHFHDPRYDLQIPRLSEALRAWVDGGREVGLHFSMHCDGRDAYRGAVAAFGGIASGVTGARGHYWSIDWDRPLASWSRMAAAGLQYDASLSPFRLGFRAGTSAPLMPVGSEFVVLPTAVMDAYLIEGDAGLREEQRQMLDRIVETTKNSRGVLVLDWHERTTANVGAWRGYLDALLPLLLRLQGDQGWSFLTAGEAAATWRRHTALNPVTWVAA